MKKPVYPDFKREIAPDALSEDYVRDKISLEIPKWDIVKSPRRENPMIEEVSLYRTFHFKSFKKVTDYLVELNDVCKVMYHHPKIINMYTAIDVYLTTWAVGHKISMKDILFAKNMDRIYQKKYHAEPIIDHEISPSFIKSIEDLISEDRLNEAIKSINKYYLLNTNLPTPKQMILNERSFNANENKRIKGTIEYSTYEVERNKVAESIYEFVKKLRPKASS